MGGRIFFPKVPLAPGNCDFLFWARNLSKCQGAALGQKGLKHQCFVISHPWGSRRPKHKMEKSCAISGTIFLADIFFPQKCPKLRETAFFGFRPWISPSAKGCPRPKVPKTSILRFPAPGGAVGQNAKCKQVSLSL